MLIPLLTFIPILRDRAAWRRHLLAGATCALALQGCGAHDDTAAPADHAEHADQPGHDEHEAEGAAGPDVLRIAPDMLRDLRLTTATAVVRAAEDHSLALGELHANEQALAEVAAPIGGRIVRVLVSEGDRVAAGAPLVELESVELGRARAELVAARARAQLAASTAERARGLAAEQLAATKDVEAAQAELAAAQAGSQAARAALVALGIDGVDDGTAGGAELSGRFTLSSPQGGVVLSRDAVPGRAVDGNARLLRIADTSTLWLVVHVYERDALRVRLGGTARVELPALPGERIEGRTTWIGQEVEMPSRTLPVRVEIDNADGRLRPGLSGSALLPLDELGASVVAVPARALQRGEHGWCVFVPRGEDRFEVRDVGRGRDLGDDVEVVAGLEAGETVVVEGAFVLRAEAERRQGGGEHEH